MTPREIDPAEFVPYLQSCGIAVTLHAGVLTIDPEPAAQLADTILANQDRIIAYLRSGFPRADQHRFTALRLTDHETVRKLGVCIACGICWAEHGEPAFGVWSYVDDENTVEIVDARPALPRVP